MAEDTFDSKNSNNAEEESAHPQGGSAQVTVRANSLRTWDFFLNGENIGRIEGRGKVTAAANGGHKNVLTAKGGLKGAFTPPYEFYVENGSHLEVTFYGRFGAARRIDEAAKKSLSTVKTKIVDWLYWAVLLGYCTAVFLLSREAILPALALSFFPALIFMLKRFSTHRAMIEYLDEYHPEDLGDILRGQYTGSMWGPRDFLFVKDACDDPEYLELRRKHKRVFWAMLLLVCTMFASYFYFRFTFKG